jgi:hypothetical protein
MSVVFSPNVIMDPELVQNTLPSQEEPQKKGSRVKKTPVSSPSLKPRSASFVEQPEMISLSGLPKEKEKKVVLVETRAEIDVKEAKEPLLMRNDKRHVIFPIKHAEEWAMFKKHEAVVWNAGEIDLSKDMPHWREKLNDDERHFIKNILGFFAGSDGIVMENLAERFMREVQWPEAKHFYTCQMPFPKPKALLCIL